MLGLDALECSTEGLNISSCYCTGQDSPGSIPPPPQQVISQKNRSGLCIGSFLCMFRDLEAGVKPETLKFRVVRV